MGVTNLENQTEAILRYCRQVVLKTMDHVRARMRGSNRLVLREPVEEPELPKARVNLTKAIDKEAEDLMVASLCKKVLGKLPGLSQFTVFSEELGIRTFPAGANEDDSGLVIFIDPIDGTEFIETLQGGWSLIAVYDRHENHLVAAVAGDIFLNRLYWASHGGLAEGLDFTTHSWFKLDGGPEPKTCLAGARVNVLTTKVSRYRALARQARLLDAIEENDGRVNLSWGSNMIIQVAAGYADVAVEFARGFAAYDILPGLLVGQRAGLTILDARDGQPIPEALDIDEIFATFRRDSTKPMRTPFVAARHPELAHQVMELLDLDQ